MSSTLHDIVNGLMIAKAHAEIFGENRPRHSDAIKKLVQEIDRIRKELVSAVRGQMR